MTTPCGVHMDMFILDTHYSAHLILIVDYTPLSTSPLTG